MIRSTRSQKVERLNAAYTLLAQGVTASEAVLRLSQRFGFAELSDPTLDRGQELDPALLVECGEKPVDAGLVSDPECLGESGLGPTPLR